MKKLLILFVLATTALTAMQCCKTDPKPIDPIDLLPPATQTGENSFGCLVNGEAFVATNTSKQVAIFQQGQLQFGGGVENTEIDENMTMITGDPLEENVVYNLSSFPVFKAMYQIRTNTYFCRYEFENTFEGSVQFSKIDRVNFIISGTFEFATVIDGCDTVRITNGRFDMQYIP